MKNSLFFKMNVSSNVSVACVPQHGIGRDAALLFASNGAKGIVGDMNAPAGEETAQAITDAGGTAIFVNIDVSIESEVEQAVQTAETHFGKLTTVFNNAGNVTGTALQRGDKKPIAALFD